MALKSMWAPLQAGSLQKQAGEVDPPLLSQGLNDLRLPYKSMVIRLTADFVKQVNERITNSNRGTASMRLVDKLLEVNGKRTDAIGSIFIRRLSSVDGNQSCPRALSGAHPRAWAPLEKKGTTEKGYSYSG